MKNLMRDRVRELMIASTVGMLGIVALVFGLQGYFDPESALVPLFADPVAAAIAVGGGLLACLVEIRLLLPILKDMAAGSGR